MIISEYDLKWPVIFYEYGVKCPVFICDVKWWVIHMNMMLNVL